MLLDEYQDTGHAQRVLLRGLFGAGHPVTAVGDPFQSIYGWRGASAGNLAAVPHRLPGPDGAPADEYGLLTSFRNPPEVLALANAVAAPLRAAGGRRRGRAAAGPGTGAGDVRVALLPDVAASRTGWPTRIAARWQAAANGGAESPRPPSWCAAGRTWTPRRRAAGRATCRSRSSASAGCSTPRRSATWSAPCAWSRIHCRAGGGAAAHRPALAGGRGDLAALWARARELAGPVRAGTASAAELALGALPGEHAEQAGLVDALDDPGAPGRYSPAGYGRIRRLAAELRRLRARASAAADRAGRGRRAPAAARRRDGRPSRPRRPRAPRRVRRRRRGLHRRAEVSTLPALLDYLDTAERAEEGLDPGEVEVAPDRVQVLTVHAAKGLEWDIVAVPHLVGRCSRAARSAAAG